ncbi:MAG: 23S rRNA (adenine(2503)-C(2))-methyltransferase RlmN [Deltaproteobacteria bacterium]|nr:23S rRNA (adenine(2503)-C(2))-methyltransferase RlmN [Deltaproteobacteria bacterium]
MSSHPPPSKSQARREAQDVDLRSLDLNAITALIKDLGEAPYRAEQVFTWIHRRGVASLVEMTNVPKTLREALESRGKLQPLDIDALQTSRDGTRKLRLRCPDDDAFIEAVLIPRRKRDVQPSRHSATIGADDPTKKQTLCISSQVGCALGCIFCATATLGLKRNLLPGEIVDQVYRAQSVLDPGERIRNLVFMGMGEPLVNLDNVLAAVHLLIHEKGLDLSPRRITVSTVGHVTGIEKLGRQMPQLGLAISLHATTDVLRSRLIPINRRWPLRALFAALRAFPLPRRRRITFEYMMLAGLNDTPDDARRLPKLLDGIPAKVNLLPYNPWRQDQPDLRRPEEEAIDDFAERLRDKGLTVTVRQSRGLDIAAACGQLALDGDGNS